MSARGALVLLVFAVGLATGAVAGTMNDEVAECPHCAVIVHCPSRCREGPCPTRCRNGHVVRCKCCPGVY